MDWARIRTHYAARFTEAKKTGLTQEAVAATGALKRQNAISKLMANRKRGPSVDTFVKAVEGLGVSVSAFFAEIEAASPSSLLTGSSSLTGRAAETPPGARQASERLHEYRPISTTFPPQALPRNEALSDRAHLEAVIEANFQVLAGTLQRRIDQLSRDVAEAAKANPRVAPRPARPRRRRRRHVRKTA